MKQYLALLRGVNVGGNSLIKMIDLKEALEEGGFHDVRTYIQSGNVFLYVDDGDRSKIARSVEKVIHASFSLDVRVVIFSKKDWAEVIMKAPKWWGQDAGWKHNLLVLLESSETSKCLAEIGPPKEGIDLIQGGIGVIYQSVDYSQFGKSTYSRLASKPVYKRMTIRNYNTANKLATLFD